MKQTLIFSLVVLLFACAGQEKNKENKENKTEVFELEKVEYINTVKSKLDSINYQNLLTDLATRIMRKPDAATWQTKFNPEFRDYFLQKSQELEWVADLSAGDTTYVYLVRDGKEGNNKSNRGVGARLIMDGANKIGYFEELFVTKIIDRLTLEGIGQRFMAAIETGQAAQSFIDSNKGSVEWPDGRLFYSVEKSEWRYEK